MDAPTRATWTLRGPVREMSTHIAEWDATRQEWERVTLWHDAPGAPLTLANVERRAIQNS